MASLFLRVFLWFWLAVTVVVAALAAATLATQEERSPRPPEFVRGLVWAYSRGAVEAYRRGGSDALRTYEVYLEREAKVRALLFDRAGVELSGREVTQAERTLSADLRPDGAFVTRRLGQSIYEACAAPSGDGGVLAFVVAFPQRPPGAGGRGAPPGAEERDGPPGGPGGPPPLDGLIPRGQLKAIVDASSAAVGVRVLAVLLSAGLLCFLLASSIVGPVVRLRAVARQVAAGDLSARVGPLLGGRRDELAEMGRDFDLMASRIEALIGAQQRLIRDISHELRSPLARLGVALGLAQKRAGPDAAGHLARIEREADRLREMINQLLSLSHAETVGERLGSDVVDLGSLLREVVDDADYEARSRGGSVELTSFAKCLTFARRTLLRSAFENIVRNAIRHGPAASGVAVTLRYERQGAHSHAVVEVVDQGPGVPTSALSEIFRPFYRVDDSRSRETGGAGLGLAITERAVRLHGGTVHASNLPGGFRVSVRLPLAEPSDS